MAVRLISVFAVLALAGGFDRVWCSPDGRRIAVDGLAVITPGGQRATGAYHEQDFAFPVPDNERDAGSVIWIEPVDENTARVSIVGAKQVEPPPHDRWRRCDVTS